MQHYLPTVTVALLFGATPLASASPFQRPQPLPVSAAEPILGAASSETPAVRVPGRSLVPGTDTAAPAPQGEVLLEPRFEEPFTGLSDAELAALPPAGFDLATRHDVLHYTPDGADLWVRGRTYKARAGADGFTFIPFLGSKAPRNYPLALRLRAATLGGDPLSLADASTFERAGDRVVLDRGPVDVRYDLALDSVEQSFLIEEPTPGGDLVLELDVNTGLEPGPHAGGFRFRGPHGGVDYSGAFVVDAEGRREAIPTELVGATLRLRVPSAFLESATLPVVVDPVITTFAVDTVSGDQRRVDVAYDFTTDDFLFVYEDTFSGADVDVYRTVCSSNGVFVSGGYIDSSSDSWLRPKAANLNVSNQFIIVAERENASDGSFDVVGRLLSATGGSLGPVLLIGESNAAWDNFEPDVGGSLTLSSQLAVVVWTRRFSGYSAVRYRTVDVSGALGAIQFPDGSTSLSLTGAVISESSGDPASAGVFNVAYRADDFSSGNVKIRSFQLNVTGAVVAGPSTLLTLPPGVNAEEVDVTDAVRIDGQSSPTYVVSYDRYATVEEDTYLLFCRNASNVTFGAGRELQRLEHAPLDLDQADARVAAVDNGFIVMYSEENGFSDRVYMSSFNLTEGSYAAINERRTVLGDTGQGIIFDASGLVARSSGGFFTSLTSAAGWTSRNGSDYDALAATHSANLGFSQAFQYCYGNPNSTGDRGFLAMYGSRSTTAIKRLVATALPSNSFGYFLCAPGMGETNMPGGSAGRLCLSGSIGRYSSFVQTSGATGTFELAINPQALSQPSGQVAAMAGQIWNFQAWHRDSAGGTSTSNFTNAVTILFQ